MEPIKKSKGCGRVSRLGQLVEFEFHQRLDLSENHLNIVFNNHFMIKRYFQLDTVTWRSNGPISPGMFNIPQVVDIQKRR